VTVKLDGSCVSVARINGEIVALSRAGYLASSSKYEQHQLFDYWVRLNRLRFMESLHDGERFVGEWLAQAHGTRYNLWHEPFVVFDLMIGVKRLPTEETRQAASRGGLVTPAILSHGCPFSIEDAKVAIQVPRHGEIDPVEGAVWRVERKGEFDFICKWVRPDKLDGVYLPEISGKEAIWNWRPKTRYFV
jgi:hypothetical protein